MGVGTVTLHNKNQQPSGCGPDNSSEMLDTEKSSQPPSAERSTTASTAASTTTVTIESVVEEEVPDQEGAAGLLLHHQQQEQLQPLTVEDAKRHHELLVPVPPPPYTDQELPLLASHSGGEGEADEQRRSRRRLTLWQRHKLSLSRAQHWLVTLLIPLLSLLTHYIFYYGQTAPMWHLHLSQQVDLWANATNFEARTAFHQLGLPYHNYYGAHDEKHVKTFSYWYAIHELWKAAHMPGKVLPRTAAILLVVFSGIWPHLKLLLLNCTWLFSIHQQRRTRILSWLSTLGKWSLADVLVVCVMVGVLHLDWHVDPDAMHDGLVEHLPFCLKLVRSLYSASDICTQLLGHVDCHVHHKRFSKDWTECKTCVGFIKTALDYPEQARDTFKGALNGVHFSGGGQVTLRVLGHYGIYAFGAAVILSILISLLVDILDVRAHRARHSHASQSPSSLLLLPNSPEENGCGEDNHSGRIESSDGDSYDMNEDEEPSFWSSRRNRSQEDAFRMEQGNHHHQRSTEDMEAYQELIRSTSYQPPSLFYLIRRYACLALTLVTIFCVLMGIFTDTIQRSVEGALPSLLRDVLGVDWDRQYSLFSLVQTTGAAGGMDYLLMGTFGLFVVAGPALRGALCLLAWTLPPEKSLDRQSRRRRAAFRQTLLAVIELVGAFCAWEVFLTAVIMVDMLMPAITSTVYMDPRCALVDTEHGSCLKVKFDLQRTMAWVIGGGLLLVFVSNVIFGSRRRPSPQQASVALLEH